MKSLKAIQTISKVAKVFSSIIFIFSIVGFCLCTLGILSMAFDIESFKLGGVTFESILQDKADLSEGALYAAAAQGMIYCAGTVVLAKFSEVYFRHEIDAGTPFTFDGAKELMRLGILFICISIGEEIIASIVTSVLAKTFTDAAATDMDTTGTVTVGIALIIISFLCRYGAELAENKAEEKTGSDKTEA